MFYEIRYVDSIIEAPLWFDPDTLEVINVIDMEETHGPPAEGLWVAQRGDIYINEERLHKAAKDFGFFRVEEEPLPPKPGRKGWDPRPWRPPPKPGYLFWMPAQPKGYELLEAFKLWQESNDFEGLPSDVQADVLFGAELVFTQYGFDGGAEESVGVIRRGRRPKVSLPYNSQVTDNPEQALKHIFEKWAINPKAKTQEDPTLSGSSQADGTCSLELREWGENLYVFLWDKEAMDLISGFCVTGADWLTGSCGILADALVRWLGSDAKKVMVTSEVEGGRIPVHVAVQIDGCYLDAEGVSTEEELLERWKGRVLDPRIENFKAASGIISDARTSRRLAKLLETSLGPGKP